MSIPPYVDAPDGVAVLTEADAPLPLLLAEPPEGRPVRGTALLVPGFTGSKEDFIAVLRPLANLGWRVAAVDLPGQNGAMPLGPRGSNTPAALAGAVAGVARWLNHGEAVGLHVVGHSAGGLVTAELLRKPELRAVSWTLICSGAGPLPPGARPELAALLDALGRQPLSRIWAAQRRSEAYSGGGPQLDRRVAKFLKRRFLANDPEALADLGEALIGRRVAAREPTEQVQKQSSPASPCLDASQVLADAAQFAKLGTRGELGLRGGFPASPTPGTEEAKEPWRDGPDAAEPLGLRGPRASGVEMRAVAERLAEHLAVPGAPMPAVITGSADDAWPVDLQEELAQRIGAQWHLLHGVGHSPAAQAPITTARVLDSIWTTACTLASAGPPAAPADQRSSGRSQSAALQESALRAGVIRTTPGYRAFMALHATLECDRLAPRTARRAVCDFLVAHDLDRLTDDAALLTSELVTNAVRHACGPISLDAYVQSQRLRLEVADDTPEVGPAPRQAHPNDENGRGMELVAKLAASWGWRSIGERKVVWLELSL